MLRNNRLNEAIEIFIELRDIAARHIGQAAGAPPLAIIRRACGAYNSPGGGAARHIVGPHGEAELLRKSSGRAALDFGLEKQLTELTEIGELEGNLVFISFYSAAFDGICRAGFRLG